MKIVNEWPRTITTEAGIICNPTPEQCIQAGYELAVPPTAEEIAQIEAESAQAEAQRAQQEAERVAVIEALQQKYHELVAQFCQLTGREIVTKLENELEIVEAINAANNQNNFQLSLILTQIGLYIQNIITELRRKDGDDAWQRL